MTFEIVQKSAGLALDSMQVSITNNGFSFGSKLIEEFGDNDYVEIYLDTTRRKVGFRITDSRITGFKLQRGLRAGTISNPPTARRLEKGIYEAKIEEGFVVVNVPRILKKGQEEDNGKED